MDRFDILCLHPVYIINPKFYRWVLLSKFYCFAGEEHYLDDSTVHSWYTKFPHKMFSRYRHIVTKEQLASSYTYDNNGELVYMFIVVPCGHCNLCLDRKDHEWSTRALCESQCHDRPPYFLTLTYNNAFLPLDGVSKRHVQLFLKRLRKRLDFEGYPSIRYIFTAEYGKNTGRPHYHALIWNMPNLPQWEILHYFEQAWSYCRNKKDKYYAPLGFCYCQPARDCSGQYVMKYMNKFSKVPKGKNETFTISSRRNGIGYAYITDHTLEIYKNLDVFGFKITDKFTSTVHTFALPSYFKKILFPSPSSLVTKDFRDCIKYYLNLEFNRISIGKDLGLNPDTSKFEEIWHKFAFRLNIYDFNYDDPLLKLNLNSIPLNLLGFYQYLTDKCNTVFDLINDPFCVDLKMLDFYDNLKQDRLKYISMMDFPDFNKEARENLYKRKQVIYLQNEIF